MLTFAIGDIHGCHDKLARLLQECRRYADGRPTKYIFLGDLIDRGPDSRAVVQTVMDLQAHEPENVIALAGNHEELLRASDTSHGLTQWLANGGSDALSSYGVTSPKELPPTHISFLHNLPTHYDDGQRFFVHAGIRPGVPLDRQSRDDLLWIREPFLSSAADHGRIIVHGHTPIRSGKPDIRLNRINLDTGAVFGRALTAAVFVDRELYPTDVIQVP